MNGVVAAFSAAVAVAALVVAIVAIPASPDEAAVSDLRRTPDLGLSFWQGDKAAVLHDTSVGAEGLVPRVTVDLGSGPFEVRFPELAEEDLLALDVREDDSGFHVVEGADTNAPVDGAAFLPGKGHVDSEQGSATLYVSHDGLFNAIGGQRAGDIGNRKASVYYSRIDLPQDTTLTQFPTGVYEVSEASLVPLTELHRDLYVVAWRDNDHDDVVDGGEYEYIVLNFPG
ncbi:hypothetical protein [Actinokineospora bangkokensis]|uniref:Uncharacterized protein n=1 Tax=Actinokineospora bangkokensis TaxID=1193682 RepID=A0A1Q9LMI4_9PSEU|nr:hypothetical protein [Actinokineospora bangkokensis]OLR93204.1 hypothetical protein BJP25_17065 [Actinokineospora bangkokensis]